MATVAQAASRVSRLNVTRPRRCSRCTSSRPLASSAEGEGTHRRTMLLGGTSAALAVIGSPWKVCMQLFLGSWTRLAPCACRQREVVLSVEQASAGLFGGKSKQQQFYDETKEMIDQVEYTLSLEKDDPSRDSAIEQTRKMTNEWVAKWRRDKKFAGKPSYSNVYSVLNAISGHYNSFGTRQPLPERRRERIAKARSVALPCSLLDWGGTILR